MSIGPDGRPTPQTRLIRLARLLLPWGSLAAGVGGALLMNRAPERAWMVALAVGLGWCLTVALSLLQGGVLPVEGRARGALRFVAIAGTQSLYQTALFFVLPLYWDAAYLDVGHGLFLLVLAAAAGLSLWDPVWEWIVARPPVAIPLKALASFTGLVAVLPMFGVGNGASLWWACGITGVMVPLASLASAPAEHRLPAVGVAAGVAALFPLAIALGAARLIPPAPLQLVEAGFGTRIESRALADPTEVFESVPPQLVCATAIRAPLGLHDRLFHVWSHDGAPRDRIELRIRGGRARGFRTWSRKRRLGRSPMGEWGCRVETESGQRLGAVSVRIDAEASRRITSSARTSTATR